MKYRKKQGFGNSPSDKFVSVMSDFLSVAAYNFSEVEEHVTEMRERVGDLVTFSVVQRPKDLHVLFLTAHSGLHELFVIHSFICFTQFEKVTKCYGEDPKRIQPEEFFGVFSTFLNSFLEAKIDNDRFIKQKEEEEKRIKMEQTVRL